MNENTHDHQTMIGNVEVVFQVLLLLMAIGYSVTAWQCRRRSLTWTVWQEVSFWLGIALLLYAAHPTIMVWAHHDIEGHMVQHLIIGMYAPIFLVLGAPVLLLLKAMPVRRARGLVRLLSSPFMRVLSHPLAAMILNIGGMFMLYLTPLFGRSLHSPLIQYLIHLHFLLAGFLFTWAIIGREPLPHRPSVKTRGIVLFLSAAAHAFLGKHMYARGLPLDTSFSEEALRAAAKTMYYWGDLSELILAIIFFASTPALSQWQVRRPWHSTPLSFGPRKKTHHT